MDAIQEQREGRKEDETVGRGFWRGESGLVVTVVSCCVWRMLTFGAYRSWWCGSRAVDANGIEIRTLGTLWHHNLLFDADLGLGLHGQRQIR